MKEEEQVKVEKKSDTVDTLFDDEEEVTLKEPRKSRRIALFHLWWIGAGRKVEMKIEEEEKKKEKEDDIKENVEIVTQSENQKIVSDDLLSEY